MDETSLLSMGIFFSTIVGILGAYVATKYKPNSLGIVGNLIIGAIGCHVFLFLVALLGINNNQIINAIFAFIGGFGSSVLASYLTKK